MSSVSKRLLLERQVRHRADAFSSPRSSIGHEDLSSDSDSESEDESTHVEEQKRRRFVMLSHPKVSLVFSFLSQNASTSTDCRGHALAAGPPSGP